MKKSAYKKELTLRSTQERDGVNNRRNEVIKIQSWLNLYGMQHPASGTATSIDGAFGPATERAVENFQSHNGLNVTGVVDAQVFSVLCGGMAKAFETPLQSVNLRDKVLEAAHLHLSQHPLELQINGEWNSGPWVRSYMDGNDGSIWFWCMGFVQTIIDQAASELGKDFTKLMPLTYSCDTVGQKGIQEGYLHRYQQLRKKSSFMEPGDIFLIQKSKFDWVHTGIIMEIQGETIQTIEGNTNQAGSRNGIAVMKRIRNFHKSKIDVFSIDSLI
ncbi:Putative peptidoglycan binding domain-containing protein [Tenacibaculum sp. MAR_2009_124]|uniref:peptidoglycan-binding domain-containing protein n=1 Tax=Tenacibaculum sp. MAR_2009_124 TaxID=1250059 RepID=UPI0008997DA2|nr:peptidoglycan-binding domain-containing protein [Tenacibaculum sp. MAR_2009_124]SEC20777.1 Putative peptidoglycan binding domain-containing protein [Tenacibaculum sp. MAR_2009_124]